MLGLGRDDIISDGHASFFQNTGCLKKFSITYVAKICAKWGKNLAFRVRPIFLGINPNSGTICTHLPITISIFLLIYVDFNGPKPLTFSLGSWDQIK